MAEFKYKDVYEFQKKHKTKEEREKVLSKLNDAEIWHLANTCGNKTSGVYYSSHIKNPAKYRKKEK